MLYKFDWRNQVTSSLSGFPDLFDEDNDMHFVFGCKWHAMYAGASEVIRFAAADTVPCKVCFISRNIER